MECTLRVSRLQEVQGCNWIELPASTYKIRSDGEVMGRCSLEVDVVYTNIISHASTGLLPLPPLCQKKHIITI